MRVVSEPRPLIVCHFITAILPKYANIQQLELLATKHGMRLSPQVNLSISQQIKPDELPFLTTAGHCDCGTSLGSDHQQSFDIARESEKLRKKGWSESKILRSLGQKERGLLKSQEKLQADAQRWQDFIVSAIRFRYTPYIGLLLHLYHGSLDEQFAITGSNITTLASMSHTSLTGMHENVIQEFRTHV